ncbi:MAG TPA: hypothetical protein PKI19_09805 [Elusimicrobiales bacterium]|nr:hypothetical protein [Elusimicrobiales bacterium]
MKQKIETALSITPSALRARPPAALGRFDLVYLGGESCPHLLPGPDDVRRALRAGARGVVIVSSILTERHLAPLVRLVGGVIRDSGEAEVSVNDVGALHLLAKKYGARVKFSLGRLISRDFLKMSPDFLRSLCERYRIRIIETNDVRSASECIRAGTSPIAFHHPLQLLSVTHVCPFAGPIPAVCSRPCGDRIMRLRHPKLGGRELFLRHNEYLMPAAPGPLPAAQRLILTFCAGAKSGKQGRS